MICGHLCEVTVFFLLSLKYNIDDDDDDYIFTCNAEVFYYASK